MMLSQVINGKPRKPQIEKLVAHFKSIIDAGGYGKEIPHADIESVIGEARGTSRAYYGIITRARYETLRQTGVWIDTFAPIGYMVPATGESQIVGGVNLIRSAKKKIARGGQRIGGVSDSRLDDSGIKKRDHLMGVLNRLNDVTNQEVKRLCFTLGKPDALPTAK